MPKRKTLAEYQGSEAQQETTSPPQPSPVVRPVTRREHVRLDAFAQNPWQPRTTVDPEHVREIADSIASVGLLQRPLARPGQDGQYQIAFGHQRVEAVRLLASEGRWPWPALEVDVRDLSDREMALIALSENAKRRDLKPLEVYRAWQKVLLIEGMTQEALAEALGIARPTLTNALRVLALPPVVLERVDSGELSVHAARELLCLMAEDHAHVDIMEGVIRQIAGTQLGSAPDWRGGNVRKRIMEQLAQKLTGEWRHLGAKGLIGMGVHGYGTDFDADAFAKSFPQRVHLLPDDEPGERRGERKERSLAWTCDPKEWRRWQDRVKTAAQWTMSGVRESKADEELRTALAHDPVAKRLLSSGVSAGTIAKEVIERHAQTVAEVAARPSGDDKAMGYIRLNAHVGSLMRDMAHGSREWLALDTLDTAKRLHSVLGLAEFGLNAADVYAAVRQTVLGIDKDIAREKAAQKPGLTAEQRSQLGPRGEPLLNLQSTKAWHRSLNVGQYNGPPIYFPDVKECLERCVIGARYGAASSWEGPRLVCTNPDHFGEKLEAGKAAFRVKVEAQRAAMAGRDGPIIDALAERFTAAGDLLADATALALLTATDSWRKIRLQNEEEFAFTPPALDRMLEALGIKASANPWAVFTSSEALQGLDKHPEQASLVAAALMVHVIGESEKNLKWLAEGMGVAKASETPIGDSRAAAQERVAAKRAGRRAKASAAVAVAEDDGEEDDGGDDATAAG